MKKTLKILAAMAFAGVATYAFAQSFILPSGLPASASLDYVQVIKNGTPQAQSYYIPLGALGNISLYQNLGVITTGNTFAVTAGNVFAQPAATLAAVTLTAPATPSDGAHVCFTSSTATTALTLSANTGQTVVGSPIAGQASIANCWLFQKSNSTWYPSA
jgi:hypothetical protein